MLAWLSHSAYEMNSPFTSVDFSSSSDWQPFCLIISGAQSFFHTRSAAAASSALTVTKMSRTMAMATSSHSGIGVLAAERERAVRRAGDVEIEREVLVDRLQVAQVALQRVARVDGVGAVARPQRLDRLACLAHRVGILRAPAQLGVDIRYFVSLRVLFEAEPRLAHEVRRRVDQHSRLGDLDLHRLEVGDLGARIRTNPGFE